MPAFIIAPILTLLHRGYGIGTGGEQSLRAPQASLFAGIAKALFEGTGLPWTMTAMGVGIAVGLIILDRFLQRSGSRFRAHVMPVAVGIYLPLALSTPILVGGLLSTLLAKQSVNHSEAAANAAQHKAVLIASGLIAGEAIAGILIAIPRTAGMELPVPVIDSNLLSLAALAAAILLIYRQATRD